MRAMTKGLVIGVGGTLIFGIAVWLTVAYTGLYNIAASDTVAAPPGRGV